MKVEDVGALPTLDAPAPGERLRLRLDGAPPSKTFGRSMRNDRSTQRPRFMALRRAAITAMSGRKWYEDGVGLTLTYWAPQPASLLAQRYLDGVMDTLGASQGPTFIYLPIAYLDDCQVVYAQVAAKTADTTGYELVIDFLA